jgi:hypothetical protein
MRDLAPKSRTNAQNLNGRDHRIPLHLGIACVEADPITAVNTAQMVEAIKGDAEAVRLGGATRSDWWAKQTLARPFNRTQAEACPP